MSAKIVDIKKDRLRYINNKTSANLMYVAILFNVLYFVNIYQTDVNNYYYSITIGCSVLCNLMFLLIAFLSSEGLKNYKLNYSYVVMGLGVLQLLRILGIPTMAHNTLTVLNGVERMVMTNGQYMYVIGCLVLSAAACFAAGVIGYKKTTTLTNYKKENGLD
ncbi:MAG: hypothetical protein J6K75_09870 [Erysipelotrichaceae bacterium]|nr:hypothetical protein [Erysipelotrichaceae bacterium]